MMTRPDNYLISNRHQSSTRMMLLLTVLLMFLLGFVLLNGSLQPSVHAALTATPTPDLPSQLATAERQTDETLSLYWAAQAQLLYEHGDVPTALALAIEANRIPNPPSQSVKTLEDLAYAPGPHRLIRGDTREYPFLYWTGAFSPSGETVLVGDDIGQLLLIETESGHVLQRFQGHPFAITAVAFSRDGSKILSAGAWYNGGEPDLILWDVATGQQVWYLTDLEAYDTNDWIASITFSPDGRSVLTNGNRNHLIMWDTNSGREIHRFKGDNNDHLTGDVAYSPDGRNVISGTDAGDLILWDINSKQEVRRFTGHRQKVIHLAFSPDGVNLLSSGDRGELILWDVVTAQQIPPFTAYSVGDYFVTQIAFNPDGASFFASTSRGDLILWDISTGHRIQNSRVIIDNLAFSPDRSKLLAFAPGFGLLLWDVSDGQEIRRFKGGHSGVVQALSFSPDGHSIVSAGERGELVLWNANTGGEIRRFKGHWIERIVNSVSFSPDGRMIASAGNDGRVILWDANSGEEIRHIETSASSVVFSLDGNTILTAGGEDGAEIILWNIKSGQEIRRFAGIDNEKLWDHAVFSPDGQNILSGTYEGELILWDTNSGEEIRRLDGTGLAIFTPDGRGILTQDTDKELVLRDPNSGNEIQRFRGNNINVHTPDGKDYGVTNITFSSDGQTMLTSGYIFDLTLWDVSTGQEIRHFGNRPVAVFSPDGGTILSVSNDNYSQEGILLRGSDLILWRIDTLDELIEWILANRVVATLTCDQRQIYNVTPLCANGTPPVLTPYQTWTPSPTATATPTTDLTRTTGTPTPSITPTIPTWTPTAIGAMTLTFTPSPTATSVMMGMVDVGQFSGYVLLGGSQLWRYEGRAGEVLTIRVNAAFPLVSDQVSNDGGLDSFVALYAPDANLLASNDDRSSAPHYTDSLIAAHVLPVDGIYLIEVRDIDNNKAGGYTLIIESQGVSTATPTPNITPTIPTWTPAANAPP